MRNISELSGRGVVPIYAKMKPKEAGQPVLLQKN